jgi:hypothetical protein
MKKEKTYWDGVVFGFLITIIPSLILATVFFAILMYKLKL